MSQIIIETGKSIVLDNGFIALKVVSSNEKFTIVEIDSPSYVTIETEQEVKERERMVAGYYTKMDSGAYQESF